jgi:hypothetical protein
LKKLAILFIALFSAAAFAQELPKIAVYVTGNVGEDEKKALGTRMLATLVNSGRYKGIERSNSFLAEIEKEQEKQRSGDIDDSQISALGKQFGVKFVCIAAITPVLGDFQVSARIVDVETAEVIFIGEAFNPMKTTDDLAQVSDQVVKNMFGKQTDNIPARGTEYAVQPKQEIVVAGSARKPKYVIDTSMDFTPRERLETWALNIVPGLGSAVIMKDTWGAIINASIGGSVIALYFYAVSLPTETEAETDKRNSLAPFAVAGYVLWFSWNTYRSITYHHPDSKKIVATPLQGLNVAVLPDQDGNIKGYVAYRVEF